MQVQNYHVDKAVAKVTLVRYVDTALFYVYSGSLNRISISFVSIYLDCVTSKGKGPRFSMFWLR